MAPLHMLETKIIMFKKTNHRQIKSSRGPYSRLSPSETSPWNCHLRMRVPLNKICTCFKLHNCPSVCPWVAHACNIMTKPASCWESDQWYASLQLLHFVSGLLMIWIWDITLESVVIRLHKSLSCLMPENHLRLPQGIRYKFYSHTFFLCS